LILDEPDKTASEDKSQALFEAIVRLMDFKQMVIITHKNSAMSYLKDQGANVWEVIAGEFTKQG